MTAEASLVTAMQRRGAAFAAVDGRDVARHYGDPADEYRALREGAALVDLPWRDRLSVVGTDRGDFLQGMLSNDVKKLAAGSGCAALLLSEQGRVVADLVVLATTDAILLDGAAESLGAAQSALERFIVADDVEITPAGGPARTFAVLGPAASEVLGRLGFELPAESYAHAPVAGATWHVARVPMPGAGGLLCRVPIADAADWWQRCLDTGGCVPAGVEAYEALRIESGVPWHGRDVVGETLALEAPYDAAISFEKGCYLGQEVMERVTARGHVNRRLVGLELAGDVRPASGTRLFAADRDIGWVTSVAWSWRLGCPIALAYVRREHLAPGTALAVGVAGGSAATVRALPF